MATPGEGWPSEHRAAWVDAAAAAQNLARSASVIVLNLHQVRVPTDQQTQRVQEMLTEMVDALNALNKLEKVDG
jgi:dihydroorotate dehydrogenase